MLFNLNELGLLQVSGQGAKQLLQGQLTCNMDEINASQTRLGAHCNPQGRVISLFRVIHSGNNYLLLMLRSMIPIATQALQKYAPFFKAELIDVSNEYTIIGRTNVALKSTLEIDEIETNLIRITGKEPRYIQLSAKDDEQNLQPYSHWHRLDITSSIPTIYPETSGMFLPHELNLPALNAVSFSKGCYTGQEIIARMQYRGKLKSQLLVAYLTTDQSFQRGDDIYANQQPTGKIVDYCQIDYNKYVILVVTQITQNTYLDPQQTYPLDFNV